MNKNLFVKVNDGLDVNNMNERVSSIPLKQMERRKEKKREGRYEEKKREGREYVFC